MGLFGSKAKGGDGDYASPRSKESGRETWWMARALDPENGDHAGNREKALNHYRRPRDGRN